MAGLRKEMSNEENIACLEIMKELLSPKNNWVKPFYLRFNAEAVMANSDKERPGNLKSLWEKLDSGKYCGASEFIADLKFIIRAAKKLAMMSGNEFKQQTDNFVRCFDSLYAEQIRGRDFIESQLTDKSQQKKKRAMKSIDLNNNEEIRRPKKKQKTH